MSRIENVKKNVKANYLTQILNVILAFIVRTIFIRKLGAIYLGVNGLFANILGLLALAELGFGTALNYEMYAPVAQKNYAKVKALLSVYRRIYHLIALFITIVGVVLLPFLSNIIKDPGNIGNIYIYFIIYLLISVASYISSYMFSITNAEQKEYISSYFSMVTALIANILQIIVLLFNGSFTFYLSTTLVVSFLQQIVIYIYFRKNYKHVLQAEDINLDIETKEHIKKNIGGLITSKFADVINHQTDNIIVAAGMNIVTVGYADNYNSIITYLKNFILVLMKSAIPSMGNMAASEDKEYCYRIFKIYDLIGFLVSGFCTVCLVTNIQTFISLWAGTNMMIDNYTMIMLVACFYLSCRSYAFNNYKTAFGVFYDIKLTSIVAVAINIGASILGVYYFGLFGVYLGTFLSQLYMNIRVPRIAYNNLTGHRFKEYIIQRIVQIIVLAVPICVVFTIKSVLVVNSLLVNLITYVAISVLITVAWFYIIYGRTKEFKAIIEIAIKTLGRKNK